MPSSETWGSWQWHQHYPTIFNGSHLIPESSLTPHTDKWGLGQGQTNLPVTYPLLSGQHLLPPALKPQGLGTCVPSTQNVPCPFRAHSLFHPFRIPIKLNYLPRSSMTTPFKLQTSAQLFPFSALFSCTDWYPSGTVHVLRTIYNIVHFVPLYQKAQDW